ncbi:MAG: InlB B-repeat-containing protein [Coriobacteriales bacterium]|jgi:hypothetical protein|nr:InlB B-repeat-containing protein [Coriobacteriales bacterium]
MGVLSKALAILLALNMAVMFALPIGIFADEVIVSGDVGVTYGESQPGTESPEVVTLPNEESIQTPVEGVVITPQGSELQGSFQPLGITPMEVRNASNWTELCYWITNAADGDTILLTKNIQREGGIAATNDLPAINKNLTIDGGGYELSFTNIGTTTAIDRAGFQLASRSVATNFTLRNIKIARTNATTYPLISANGSHLHNYQNAATANWTISIADLSTTGAPTSSFISASDSVVSFSGTVSWEMPSTSPYWNMNVKGVTFEENSNVSLSSGDNVIVIYPAAQNASTYTYVELKAGAQATVRNLYTGTAGANEDVSHQSAIRMNQGNNTTTTSETATIARALLKLSGAGTSLTCSSNGNGYGRWGGVIVVAGGAGGGEEMNGGHVAIDISGGAKLNVASNGAMAAMVQQVPQATLKITGSGSELNLDMYKTYARNPVPDAYGTLIDINYADYRAALRFRYVGGQTFDVRDHAEVNIIRHNDVNTGHPAAVRFGVGPYNSFYVRSGGLVHIENQGNGTPMDASAAALDNGQNAAIEYDADYYTFDVSGDLSRGEVSSIELIATQGPAVNASVSKYGTINVGNDAVFFATGRTASAPTTADSAIFKAGNGLKFTADNPLYYDFTNLRPGGGNIFSVSSSGTGAEQSVFSSTNSDVALWGNSRYPFRPYDDVTGDPSIQFSRISYVLAGANFGIFAFSDDSTFQSELGTDGLMAYTRISGNNANPVITSSVLTNADKIVRFTGTVAEGRVDNPPRPVWSDEVFGRLQHNGSGDIHVTSVNSDPAYAEEVLDNPLRGVLRYDPGTGNFLIPGDTYRITSAWRGPIDDPSDSHNHVAQSLPAAVTVVDVTPPTPVTLTSHTDGGTIWMDRGTIKGTYENMSSVTYNSEPITRIYAVISRDTPSGVEEIEVPGSTAQLNADGPGTWTITLNTDTVGWQEDDIISIIAVDSTGNKNPVTETPYHDTRFPPAPSLTVREFPVQLAAVNKEITLTPARAIQTNNSPLDRLEELIEAEATIKPDRDADWDNKGLGVTIKDDGGFVAEETNFGLAAWRAKYGPLPTDTKTYTITYQLDEDTSYTATATVTVWPFDGGDPPYIFANDIDISLNNITALVDDMQLAERNAKLIELAEATAVASVDPQTGGPVGALSPDNVAVRGHTIPAVPVDGGIYTVTFEMKTAPAHEVTVNIHVSKGPLPIINATTPIVIWTGDPAAKPANALLPNQFKIMDGVRAWAADDLALEITNQVTISYNSGEKHPDGLPYDANGNLVNPEDDTYQITYQIVNSASNSAIANRAIVVTSNKVVDKDYAVEAYDFVVTKTEVTNATSVPLKNALVEAQSYASAERLRLGDSDPAGTTIPIPVPASIRNLGGFSDQLNGNLTRDFTITIGAVTQVPPFEGDPLIDVNAKVIDKQVIARDGDATAKTHYAVAANNVRRTTLETTTGIADLGMADFIAGTAYPVAYEITGASKPGFSKTASIGYVIVENNIPSPVVPGQYTVKFTPTGQPTVICTVTYDIYGTPPVITPLVDPDPYESGSPLVIDQTPGASHVLTDAEMKGKMTVIDGQDGDIKGAPGSYPLLGADVGTTWVIAGGITAIDTQNVGVYSVTYTATDSDGMQATLTRAIVVDDKRYVIEKGDLNNPSDGIIIGAQNFVKQSSAVDPNPNVVRSDARAFAYNENGTPVGSTNLYIDPWPVPNYVRDAEAGTYPFTFKVQDRIGSKLIYGYVVEADVIYHGGQDEQYSLTLLHFQKNIEEAQAMVDSGNLHGAEVTEAKATIYKLVDGAPDARPYVITDNGFPGNPVTVGAWDIRFAIERSVGGVYDPAHPQYIPTATGTIKGTVSQGGLPTLDVTTPVEVQQGASFSLFGGVSLRDAEDGDPLNNGALDPATNLTVEYTLLPAGQTSVNTDVPGLYGITYSFEDSDNNPVEAQRIVVVNDGHYTVSTTDRGRVLYANSFLVRSMDVSTQPSQLNGQIKDKAYVALYDGVTGDQVDSGAVTVPENDGYSSNVREYAITLQALNSPSGVMTRDITAKVVDASILEPLAPNLFGPTTYVYGQSLTAVGIGTAEQIAAGGLPGVVDALKADSRLVSAAGALSNRNVEITQDTNNFISRLTGTDLSQKQDTFSFEIADTDGIETITLTLNTSVGEAPVLIVPRPQNFNMPVLQLDGNGNLTNAAIMTGVKATDEGAVTPADPEGVITSDVTYRIYDASGTEISVIPGYTAAIYRVVYTVEDNDYNRVTRSRALIVNDGRFVYDDEYVLSARSFIINSSLTTPSQAVSQILQYSEARAWRSDGANAQAAVYATANYPMNNTEFLCTINVSGHGAVEKDILARIVNDQSDPQKPGESEGDFNSDNGDGYAIAAHNFRINVTDAAALVAKVDTAAYAADMLSLAEAKAYDRTTENLVLGGSAVFVDDGGFALAANQPLKEGDVFNITFKVAQDAEATTVIKAFVSDANPPDLIVPAYKQFPLNTVITPAQYMEGVSASDPEDGPIDQSRISYDASAVDTSKRGPYQVIYSVTDKDYNTTTKQGVIFIDIKVLGDYAIDAYSFVKLEGSISGDNAEILASSFAKAWRIKTNNSDEWPSLPIEVAPSIGPLVKANDGYSSNATARDYTIQLGVNPEPGYTDDNKTEPITARVIDRDIISNVSVVDDNGTPANPADDTVLSPGIDQNAANPTDTDRYVIAANNATIRYSEVPGYVGDSSVTIANLIAKAAPVAYRMAGNTETTPATITNGNVQLAPNGNTIPANAIKGQSFWVTFNYENLPSIYVKVKFEVIEGNVPLIDFDRVPLVINQTDAPTPQVLPNTVLDDYVRVSDVEDLVMNYQTQLAIQVLDQNGQPDADGIDSNKIGVYKVRYTATDGDGNTTIRYRAVVVTDTRYIIPDVDGDGKLDAGAIILGARDFVVRQADVVADQGTIKSLSYAEAFDGEGNSLEANLTLTIPPSYTTGTAAAGVHNFVWGVAGYNTQKPIIGTVVVADVVDSGGKDSQYSIVASHFQRNIEDATAIVAAGDPAFIEAASARIYKLVAGAPDRAVIVDDRGGFIPLDPQVNPTGVYDIVFRIEGIAVTSQRAPIKGTVSQRTIPELEVPAPLVVWVGEASAKPVGAIDPADYNIKYGVTASDVEDVDLDVDDVIAEYVGTPVPSMIDANAVGTYQATYRVTDSDNNTAYGERVILINDGRWVPGEGRILRANPFVISIDDAQSVQPYINQQLLSSTNAELRDALTNVSITGDQLFIADTDGYGKAVGTYRVVVAGIDNPASNPHITKTVTAEVVGAEVVVVGPNDPNKPNYSIFGNNIVLTPAEAQAIVDDVDATGALLAKLSADARVSHPDGTLGDLDVVLTDTDSFLSKTFVSGAVVSNTGTYRVSLADSGNHITIPGGSHPEPLTVTVASGGLPVITAIPAPLRIPIASAPGNLTEAQLMEGVSATDPEDISLTPTILGGVPTIAADEFSVTKVTYTVTDSAGNTVTKDRAVIVDDGSVAIGTYYMLRANSFVINTADVATTNRNVQILALSEAQGWSITGDVLNPTDISVANNGGYTNSVGDYRVDIQVNNESSLVRTITAKVVNDPVIKNGDLYTISGNHFRVNVRDANVLVNRTTTEIATEFLRRADVKSYKRSETMAYQSGTKVMVSDGGFRGHAPFDPSDVDSTFTVTFKVAEDDSAEITVICTVSNAAGPDLFVPGLKSSPLGAPISDAVYREGVVASDAVDGNITAKVTYNASAVNINTVGPYPVYYEVTDNDDNTAYATGYILVGGNVDKDLGVTAYDFERAQDEVTGTDAEILAAARANAYYFDKATATLKPATAFVKDAAGYRAQEGVFAGIKIGATSDVPGIQGDPTATISATVFINHFYYTVTFNANGGILTGPDRITVADRTTLFYMPSSPVRTGYNFRYWGTVTGTQFTATTELTGDITLYAYWEAITPVTPPAPPPNVIINNPPAAGGNTFITVEPAIEEETVEVPETPTPTTNEPTRIPEGGTPTSPNEPLQGWSLFNLFAAILSLLLLVAFFVKFFMDRSRMEDYEEEPVDAQLWMAMSPTQRAQYQTRRESDYQEWLTDQQRYTNRQRVLLVNGPVLLIAIAAFIESLVVLLTTQDFGLSMGAVDGYSAVFALIVFVQLLAPMVAAIIRNGRKGNQPLQEGPHTPSGSNDVTL